MTTNGRVDPADFDPQGGTARPGGHVTGGIDPAPGDPSSPAAAREHHAKLRKDLREAGFGDHRGGDA